MKNLCSTHRFFYNGNVCPLCEKERIDNLAHRFVKNTEDKKIKTEHNTNKKEKQHDITEDDLQKLMKKFNNKN